MVYLKINEKNWKKFYFFKHTILFIGVEKISLITFTNFSKRTILFLALNTCYEQTILFLRIKRGGLSIFCL